MDEWAALYFNRAFTADSMVDELTLGAMAEAAAAAGGCGLEAIQRRRQVWAVGRAKRRLKGGFREETQS